MDMIDSGSSVDMGLQDMALNPEAAGDEQLFVRMFTKAVRDPAASLEQGRPVFVEKEHYEIRAPGSQYPDAAGPITDIQRARFPRHYKAFKERLEMPKKPGVLLEEWPAITRAVSEELKHFNIHTVEELAELSDTVCMKYMGFSTLKQRAKNYLEKAGDNATIEQLAAAKKENERLTSTVTDMQSQLNALRLQMEQMESATQTRAAAPVLPADILERLSRLEAADEKPKRGRPPKQKTE